MGAADIVPGVSGGTVAFITGIYTRLLGAIRAFNLTAVSLLLKRQWTALWQHVDGSFLLALVAGIAVSIFSLARIVLWLLNNHPEPLWALFFGLIFASGLALRSRVDVWGPIELLLLVLGCAVAIGISILPPLPLGSGMLAFFVAGMIAICAMILPGISGSFLLVLMGMYSEVLQAIQSLHIVSLIVFATGAGLGLMGFSRILHWLLQRWAGKTTAALTGFLFGSLVIVWPWKQTVSVYYDRHGVEQPLRQLVVGPTDYLLSTGEDPRLLLCFVLMVFGFGLVTLISRYSRE